MVTRRQIVSYVCVTLVVAAFAAAPAQEIVVDGGPPPVLRSRMDAFQKAFNTGDPARWEKMARAHFTDRFLKSQTAAQRRQSYTAMHAAFGTIAFNQVERSSPDSPLQVFVKGSAGSGIMWITLADEHRIDDVKAEPDKKK
jgi:hypothetical protein